ncbi:MAG: N-formylglutamate amidohydrolase [Candidatus Aenigmarchaeota archaeon]|nr:N-formylglutamate amidohydrolase [Candidatus Aenigmarchaeota archaeon]OIO43680.1 MAG: hypothetical protein AUJ64_01935 [Candidatus Pacearchaeota archaeon CG1_02_39_14]
MKVFDILTKQTKEMKAKDLITLKKRTYDYILSIPHGGTLIPVEFKSKMNLEKHILIGSDLLTEKVYKTGKGVTIASKLSSYLVDMNRFKDVSKIKKLPKHLRVDALSRLPVSNKSIPISPYNQKEKKYLLGFYDRYHSLIQESIQEMKQRCGFALLIDCHSFSSKALKNTPDKGKERPDFSLGTLDDTSAHPRIISALYKVLKDENSGLGLVVRKNNPYKGGAITRKYNDPISNIHAMQLEVKESNFMNEGLEGDAKNDFKPKKEGLKLMNTIICKSLEKASIEARKLV